MRSVRTRSWLVVAAAIVPLALLLGLQYRWLERLERVSAVASRATLDNYLEAVVSAVEVHYRSLGERALNLPAALFTPERIHKAAHYFAKKGAGGEGRLFVVHFEGEQAGHPLFFEPSTGRLEVPPWSEELRPVYVAIAPWKMLAMKHGTLERPALSVEDRDPDHRMILNPITDDAARVVGLAGLVIDARHFECVTLPAIVRGALPRFFGQDAGALPVVSVRDGAGRRIDLGEKPPARAEDAARAFAFPFPDFVAAIHGRHSTPAHWARRNFGVNLGLSVLLSAVVAGGVLFALRAASREMRLSQMKSDFVSNVSHELRTPLASIRVFGELLRLGRIDSPDKVREYGELIETESRRLTGLINNILDLARIESGRKSYRLAPADLEAVVADTLRTFRVSLAQSGFRIAYRGADAPLPPIAVDADAVGQAVANLLDNAVKYSGEARDVEVGVRRDGDWAVIWVKDSGVGIPREEQAKIFDRFHRVATGLVHDVKGSGLGLAIVRHVVEAHRGRVEVASREGAGSVFSLWLPVEAAPGAAAEPAGGAVPEARGA
jgi:two-component system phosphate regulon sensor histidine kinase PhoR